MNETATTIKEQTENAIELKNITKIYGDDVTAVDDLTLTIEPGEFFTLLGPSGSGKSTLVQMIAGFLTPSEGTIRINGADVTKTPPQDRPTSMVFQEYALFPHMSVEDNVQYGLTVRGVPQDEQDDLINKYLDMLQISELRDRMPGELSGGQRQRVALARSLVIEPEILLLDEPLGALDEKLRRHMQFELSAIQDRLDVAFIYITHDQEEALTMSDRIGLLDEGRLVEVGPPSEMYQSPKHRFTAEFLGASNILDGTVETVDGEWVTVETQLGAITGRNQNENLSPGDSAAATIRSRDTHIDRTGFENTVSGIISSSVYKGELHEYLVDTNTGTELKIATESPLDVARGDEVSLSWSRENCVVVQAD